MMVIFAFLNGICYIVGFFTQNNFSNHSTYKYITEISENR